MVTLETYTNYDLVLKIPIHKSQYLAKNYFFKELQKLVSPVREEIDFKNTENPKLLFELTCYSKLFLHNFFLLLSVSVSLSLCFFLCLSLSISLFVGRTVVQIFETWAQKFKAGEQQFWRWGAIYKAAVHRFFYKQSCLKHPVMFRKKTLLRCNFMKKSTNWAFGWKLEISTAPYWE